MVARGFVDRQRAYWRDADTARFRWQTVNPVMAVSEAALARHVVVDVGERLLEIGCGEGANLHHLRGVAGVRFGIDYSAEKTRFAGRATDAHVATADAARLPFADGSFDAVLIRDLLHHVPAPEAVLGEAHRVLRPGGRLTLLEPNSRSPLVLLQAALVPAERAVLRSSPRLPAMLAAAGFPAARASVEQPFPIERVLLHPTLGAPSLARLPGVARALAAADRVARRLLPRRVWLYLVFEAIRP